MERSFDGTVSPESNRDAYRKQLSLNFAQWLGCWTEAKHPHAASKLFLARYPHSTGAALIRKSVETWDTKAAVSAGTSRDGTWAGPLVEVQPLLDVFVALARSASLLGRIPGLRKVPFNTKIPIETSGANYQWVTENAPKPASAMAFSNGITLGPTKAAGIVVVTRELVELSGPGMEGALHDTLIAGVTAFTDKSFLDPTSAAIVDTRPASIINGTTAIPSTGNLATDVASLLSAFFTGRPNAADAVLIAAAGKAAAIRGMNPGFGLPILVSEAALGNVVVVDPAGVFVADNGVGFDLSHEANIQMNDTPDNPATAASVFVSLWQHNLAGFRIERFVNWQALTGAARYLAP